MASVKSAHSGEASACVKNKVAAETAASPAMSDVALINMVAAPYKAVEAAAAEEKVDYGKRGQWLRAAVLGANDGLVSTASLMMGVGAVKADARAMLLSGLAGLVAGACSMAIGEFVSVYSQLDVEMSQIKRNIEFEARSSPEITSAGREESDVHDALPNPFQAACASALAFTAGAVVPLLSAAFIKEHWVRMAVVVAASSLALVVFGAVGARVGKSPVVRASVRVLLGGWAAMLVTYGILRLFASVGI